jgi:hypothetical protein
MAPLLSFFLAGALCPVGAHAASATGDPAPETLRPDTNGVSAQEIQQTYVQLREQLHEMQLALERSQQDAQAAAQRATEDMAARFQLLEQSLNTQRAGEFEAMQRTNHVTLLVAGTVATVVLVAMLFTAYFQWRVAIRLAELSSVRPSLLTLASGRALPEVTSGSGEALPSPAVEQANARLLHVVEQLQQRILEFERASRPPLKEKAGPAAARPGKA